MRHQYPYYESPKIEMRKAKFMKEVWDTIIIGGILWFINKSTYDSLLWCKIPIFIMTVSLFFKGMKLFGQIAKERMKSRYITAQYGAGSQDYNDVSELLDFDDLVYQKKESKKLWKESELVKSNLS